MNKCFTTGEYEGLFYIMNVEFAVFGSDDDYSDEPERKLLKDFTFHDYLEGRWLQDDEGTMNELEDIENCLIRDFISLFPSFKIGLPDKWVKNDATGEFSRRILAESELFYICEEKTEDIAAIELIQKSATHFSLKNHFASLQSKYYKVYLKNIRDILLKRVEKLYVPDTENGMHEINADDMSLDLGMRIVARFQSTLNMAAGYINNIVVINNNDVYHNHFFYRDDAGSGTAVTGPFATLEESIQDIMAHCPDAKKQ